METNKETVKDHKDTLTGETDGLPEDTSKQDSEFKIEIRRLEVPVRPRGVLAE